MQPRIQSQRSRVVRWGESPKRTDFDEVALEEPLEIRLLEEGRRLTLATLLRTPGDDFELVAGFLYAEGLIEHARDIAHMSFCREGPQDFQQIGVRLRQGIPPQALAKVRQVVSHAGCGACSSGDFDAERWCGPLKGQRPPLQLDFAWLRQLPTQLRAVQRQFSKTGGVHAAAWCPLGGAIAGHFEDIGRHNAVDKLVGQELLAGRLPMGQKLLLLSGRAGFELIQKALRAGFDAVASLGAPTSLSVEWAEKGGLVLIGFLSEQRCNIYSGQARLAKAP